MEPLSQETSGACPERYTAIQDSVRLPPAHYVAVLFKQRQYDGSRQARAFRGIHSMAIVDGHLHLIREGYGLVFDVPYEEVEQVYTKDQETSGPMPET